VSRGSLDDLREELAATCRALAAEGLAPGTSGNLSCRAERGVLISPTGAELGELQAPQIPLVDLSGRVLDGELEPSSEIDLHLGVYRRYGAGAVVHAHPPMSTAVSCVVDELPCVHYLMVDLGGSVPVAPYLCPGTDRLAEGVHSAMKGHTAVLMSNHGTLAYAGDLAGAAARTRVLEWVSALYWRAATLGTLRTLTEAEQDEVASELKRRSYGTVHKIGT
jgi:L-fuculose-phosphate aldolase